MFWEIFLSLCYKRGVTPTHVVKEAKIAAGSVTKWKSGIMPRQPTIKKIADYFGVSVEYLLGNEKGPDTDAEPENGLIICRNGTKEIRHMTEEELAVFDAFYNTYMKKPQD